MENNVARGKRLAVFGANNVVDEVTAYARQHGIVLVSVGNVPEAPMHQVSDEQYYLDCTDETVMLPLFKEKRIDGLLNCSGEMVIRKSVGWIAKTGLNYIHTHHQWDVLMNKQHFKEACIRYGMPAIPAFRLEDKDIPFPVIVKPVDNGGSFGITICYNRTEMKEAVAFAITNSTTGEYICEKYLTGTFFQFEIWRRNGRSYIPYTKGRVFYDGVAHSPTQPFIDFYPSPEEEVFRQLYEPISSMFDELGINNGSCQFQGIIEDGVPYLIDTNFRLGGNMDFRVVHKDKGIDLVACYMQYALTGLFGEDFLPLKQPFHKCYATLCVGIKNGVIRKIRGIDIIQQLPYVYSLYQNYHEGDTMRLSGLLQQALCHIFIEANDKQELQQHINTILSILEVEDENGHSLLLDYPRTWNIN